MTRPPTLTDRQIQIIQENIDLFPAEILKLPEFTESGIARHTIRNYQSRLKSTTLIDEEEDLLVRLKQYMNRHGLPSRFHGHGGVTGFITYLDDSIRLRADTGDDSESARA